MTKAIDKDIVIIGGGAAGFFTAINIAENSPGARIRILERGAEVLTKVKVSGGGRCNVTHAEFLPKELAANYPRGAKELLGPFHKFMTGDTIEWFESRGVALKIEEDGRMFPVTDNSQTIIDCFTSETERLGIAVKRNCSVKRILKKDDGWELETTKETLSAQILVVATGSNPKIWQQLTALGHTIVPPVASLFTFNINDARIDDLPGVATNASVEVLGSPSDAESEEHVLNNKKLQKLKSVLHAQGPLLITHWGMSGPAILKLSAWGARILAPLQYKFLIRVNWLTDVSEENCSTRLQEIKDTFPKQSLYTHAQFGLPKRLWRNILIGCEIVKDEPWAAISRKQLRRIAVALTASIFKVTGKSTFKEEFVTAGGVELTEVHFKTFESKLHPNLYFAGEVLNIDAITGGFNFQNAWTGGFMVAQAVFEKC